jgi:hypothetical protein
MLNTDFSNFQGRLDNDLQGVKEQLLTAFPDHKWCDYIGNERVVLFLDGLGATIYGLHPGSGAYDMVVAPDNAEPQTFTELSVEEIISTLQQYYNNQPNDADVQEIMEKLKERAPTNEAFERMCRLANLKGQQNPEKSLLEYLPPVDWQKNHSGLLAKLKNSSSSQVDFIKKTWDAFGRTKNVAEQSATDVTGEPLPPNPDNPMNEAGGRYAQQSGAGEFGNFEVNQPSQWDNITDEQLCERYALLIGQNEASAMGTPERNKDWFVKNKRWTVHFEGKNKPILNRQLILAGLNKLSQ